MHARVATFELVDLDGVEDVVQWANEHGHELTDAHFQGYEGGLALLDHENRRIIDINLFDTEANARHGDRVLERGLPPEMPDHIKTIVKRSTRSSKGVFELLISDGRAASLTSCLPSLPTPVRAVPAAPARPARSRRPGAGTRQECRLSEPAR
jgi:hypothetical protein